MDGFQGEGREWTDSAIGAWFLQLEDFFCRKAKRAQDGAGWFGPWLNLIRESALLRTWAHNSQAASFLLSLTSLSMSLASTHPSPVQMLAIDEDDELGEVELAGFDSGRQTLLCSNTLHDRLLQVCSSHALALHATSSRLMCQVALGRWLP